MNDDLNAVDEEMNKPYFPTLFALLLLPLVLPTTETVTFPSGEITLHGVLYKPEGTGPFPAVIYNHGSAPGMMSEQAFAALGPVFASHGWVFFGPYRRGQGLSASVGPYIGDQIAAAEKAGGVSAAAATMVRLLETDHLEDQLAGLAWLRKQSFVQPNRIAVAGNSFGGIETVLGVERGGYCAGIDSAGGAQSWAEAPELQSIMTRAVRNATAPIFFFQAANDFDLSPSKTLSAEMNKVGKTYKLKIYPSYGDSPRDGPQLWLLWIGGLGRRRFQISEPVLHQVTTLAILSTNSLKLLENSQILTDVLVLSALANSLVVGSETDPL